VGFFVRIKADQEAIARAEINEKKNKKINS
jgi:hypothetical protein